MKRLMSLLIVVALLSSCCAKIAQTKIPVISKPIYSTLSTEQDDLLFDRYPEIYKILDKRDKEREGYGERLEELIRIHNEK